MTAVSYVPPNVLPPVVQKLTPLLRRKWFRELVLTPPTLTGHRFSNKTEDYGVFKPSWIAHIGQVSIYVQDIARSRRWYERLAPAAQPAYLRKEEAHPFKEGWRIRCALYRSAGDTTNVSRWSRNAIRHRALSVTGGAQRSLRHRRLKSILRPIDQAASLFARKGCRISTIISNSKVKVVKVLPVRNGQFPDYFQFPRHGTLRSQRPDPPLFDLDQII